MDPQKPLEGGSMSNHLIRVLFCSLVVGLTMSTPNGLGAAEKQGAPSAPGRPVKDHENSEIVARVHRLVNEFRREHGLAPLTIDPIISAAASEHSTDMARRAEGISHRGFKQRLQDLRGTIPYRAAAENVAVNAGYNGPARAAVEGWKQSPKHRKNMLGDFKLTGIGIARDEKGRYFFTQIFVQPLA
jgi:uncharacterized protein YkwD